MFWNIYVQLNCSIDKLLITYNLKVINGIESLLPGQSPRLLANYASNRQGLFMEKIFFQQRIWRFNDILAA